MKNIFIPSLIGILVLFTGCGVADYSNSANEIAQYCGTEEVTVGSSFYSDTGGKDVNSYQITIKNIKAVNEEEYPPALIASYVAKLFYDNLNGNDIKEDYLVNVRIELEKTAQEFTYSFKDLKRVDNFLSISQEYATMIKTREYDKFHAVYIDHKYINKQDYNDGLVQTVFIPNEHIFAQSGEINLSGFNFGEHEGIKTVEMVTETEIGENKLIYTTIYSDSKDPKILGISIR
jgi:ribosomal protein L20A (L18A)